MQFDHEKLDVYQIAIEFVAWVYAISVTLKGHHRFARDQLLRASQSIPQNIAEGNAKRSIKDRKRFFEISRGSAMECASILDILQCGRAIQFPEIDEGKKNLKRMVSMLTKMTQ